MLDCTCLFRLAHETRPVLYVLRVRRRQELQRHEPIEPGVERSVDHPHAARADERVDPVPGERRPNLRIPRQSHGVINTIRRKVAAYTCFVPRGFDDDTCVGPYRIQKQIGEGAVGRLFRVVREALMGRSLRSRRCARNWQVTGGTGAASAVRRTWPQTIRHPNLVPVVDSDEDEGTPYLVATYVDGPSLDARVRAGGALKLAQLLDVAADVGAVVDLRAARSPDRPPGREACECHA